MNQKKERKRERCSVTGQGRQLDEQINPEVEDAKKVEVRTPEVQRMPILVAIAVDVAVALKLFSCSSSAHAKPRVFRTSRSAILLNCSRSSLHILAASTLAPDSSLGSANIETTDNRTFSTD